MRSLRWASIATVVITLIVPTGATSAPASHRLNLSTGQVDGWAVLGRTPPGVRSLLGRASFTGGPPRRRYDIWGSRNDWSVKVFYRPQGRRLRAWSIVFERGPVVDPRLGNVLAVKPTRFQALVRERYSDFFELTKPYRCRGAMCAGIFEAVNGPLRITFGSTRYRATFITVWQL